MTKKTRKALLLVLSAMALVAISVGATIAYLTSTDEVVNTFTVGNVAITLDEEDVDDSTPNEERDKANGYKLMPGHTYTKDPTIHVASTSEDCWLFVKVVNGISDIETEDEENKIEAQITRRGWTLIDEANKIYAYSDIAKAEDNYILFETFTIDGGVDNTKLADYDEANINVTAYAIQADGFPTAAEAWETAGVALLN